MINRYPKGKLNAEDEGEIPIAIAADVARSKVLVRFPKPISWLAMDPDQAQRIADAIVQKAREARGH